MCSATFGWPFPRHLSATAEAIPRACSLAGAAKIARRSATSYLRVNAPTVARSFT
jgi:hypothetical protein